MWYIHSFCVIILVNCFSRVDSDLIHLSDDTTCVSTSSNNDCSPLILPSSVSSDSHSCTFMHEGSAVGPSVNITFDRIWEIDALLVTHCIIHNGVSISELVFNFSDGSSQMRPLNVLDQDEPLKEIVFLDPVITMYVIITAIPNQYNSSHYNTSYGLRNLALNQYHENEYTYSFNVAESSYGTTCSSTTATTTSTSCTGAIDNIINTNCSVQDQNQSNRLIFTHPIHNVELRISFHKLYLIFSAQFLLFVDISSSLLTSTSSSVDNSTDDSCVFEMELELMFEDGSKVYVNISSTECHNQAEIHDELTTFQPVNTSYVNIKVVTFHTTEPNSEANLVFEEVKLWATGRELEASNETFNETTTIEFDLEVRTVTTSLGLFFGLACAVLSLVVIFVAAIFGCRRQYVYRDKSQIYNDELQGKDNAGYESSKSINKVGVDQSSESIEENSGEVDDNIGIDIVSSRHSTMSNKSSPSHENINGNVKMKGQNNGTDSYSDEITPAEEGLSYTL